MIKSTTHARQEITAELAKFLMEIKDRAATLEVRRRAGRIDGFDYLELVSYAALLTQYGVNLENYVNTYYELYAE